MPRMFQVHEESLCELEALIPEIVNILAMGLNPRLRVKCRRIKQILSDVRWNYGPYDEIREVPPEEGANDAKAT